MPLQNPSNIYSAGAVTFNTQPSVNFYAQLMAKQQAKREALDQYYSKALADVTPTGMRNKDVTGGWGQKVNDWQTKYMNPEKRKYLLNPRLDNYRTVTDFNREHQDLLNDAEKSKQLLKKEVFINQQRANAKRAFTDEDVNLMDRISKSIYDPTRLDEMGNEPDETQLSINQPEFTPLQEKQMYQGATQGINKSKVPDLANQRIDKQAGMIYTPFTKQFTPEQIKAITNSYSSNLTKSALTHYEQLMHDQDTYDVATKAYQTVYGQNELIDTPQKMAKGIAAIHALSEVETGEDKVPDWSRRNSITFGQHMALIDKNKAAGLPPPNTGYLSDEVANAVGENIKLTKGGKTFDQKVIYTDKVDPVRLKIINGGGRVQPIPIKQLDGTIRYGYYQDPQTGDWQGDEGKTISRERVKDDYIKSVSPSKFKAEANTKGSENTKDQFIKNPLKPKTSYKLGNKTFSAEQVQKAAKASGMSVAEYIKQAGLQ